MFDLVDSHLHLAVGKSSLLLRFAENKFDPNFVLTIGYAAYPPVYCLRRLGLGLSGHHSSDSVQSSNWALSVLLCLGVSALILRQKLLKAEDEG